jgi:hypothetical protein
MPCRRLTVLLMTILGCAAFAGSASAASRTHRAVQHRAVQHHARVCYRTVRHGKTTRRRVVHCPRVTHRRIRRPLAQSTAVRRRANHVRSASGGLVVGLNANVSGWGDASTQPRLAQVTSRTHTKWLREDFRWDRIETTPGRFDFSYYDHFMAIAAQAGMHVLPVLYDTPAWAGATYNAIPSDPTTYAQYVAAVVGRYGTNGSFWNEHPSLRGSAIQTWEIWNEPYYSTGDNGNYNPGNYARLVKAAVIAGRAANPAAKFLLASEMQSAQDSNGNWQWWTDALYQAVPDLNNYFDGVAVHPYGSNTTTLHTEVHGQPYDNYDSMPRIQDIHQQFINHDAANKPFWITEIGWSTCSNDPSCVTPSQQAANLSTLFADLHGSWSSWVQAAFLYHYTDGDNPTTNIEDGFGLTTNTTTPKPALSIFQTQATLSAN